jgi:hypothetical protein
VRARRFSISQTLTNPTSAPATGPRRKSRASNDSQSEAPPVCPSAIVERIRMSGNTTMSFVPASIVNACRIECGTRSSRTTSRKTTGSNDARIEPSSSDSTSDVPKISLAPAATMPTVRSVPGPSARTGTSQARSPSSKRKFTASRNRTKARLRIATTSSASSWALIWRSPSPPSPSNRPSPRKMIGTEIGALWTSPETSPESMSTIATKAKGMRISCIVFPTEGDGVIGNYE